MVCRGAEAFDSGSAIELDKLSLEDLMNVKVARVTAPSKRAEKATEAPGTVIVIDKTDIRMRGYSTLKDVLRDLPGMETSEYSFTELGTQLSVRGIPSNNKVVVLVNGMRVNPPGGEYFPLRNDISVRMAEQIEVIYGHGSTLYGQDAISAVINIRTRMAPGPAPATPSGGKATAPAANTGPLALEVGGDYGLNEEWEGWLSFGKVFDARRNIRLDGYVQVHDSNLTNFDREYPNWWNDFRNIAAPKGSGTAPDRKDFGLNAFIRLEIGSFSLQSWYRNSERSSSEGYGPALLGFLREARWQDRSWVTEAKYNWRISDAVMLMSSATYNWYEVDPHSRYIFPEGAPLGPNWFLDDWKYANGNSFALEETLRIDFSRSLSMLLGGTYTTYDIIPKASVPGRAERGSDGDLVAQGGNFLYSLTPGGPLTAIPRVAEIDFARYGAYLEFGWEISPRLKVIAGGRVDKDTRIADPSYTPRGSLIWNVTDSVTAKYTYSWAYISPAPYFAFATYDRGDILNTGNPNLQPETAKTHEINVTYNKGAVNLGLSLYSGKQENLILVSDASLSPNRLGPVFLDGDATKPRVLTNTVNSGSSHNAGVDFYGKAKVARNLSTWFSYSYTTFEENTAGQIFGLKGISAHNFRLGATWAVTPRLFVTPSLVARSTPQNLDAGRLGGELENPLFVNLYLLYAPREHVEFFVDLRNLTNNHYATTGFVQSAIPQETFSGVVGMRLSF
jgi:outer membrane receptor for ferrienterochelin and colicin